VKTIVLASSSGTIAVTEKGDIVSRREISATLDIMRGMALLRQKGPYQEMARWNDSRQGQRLLLIMNPSLCWDPATIVSAQPKVVLDFMARKINAVPNGGLNFVDVLRYRKSFSRRRLQGVARRARYLLGASKVGPS